MSIIKTVAQQPYFVTDPIPFGCTWYIVSDFSTGVQKQVAMFHESLPDARNEAYRFCQKQNQRFAKQQQHVKKGRAKAA